MSCSQPIRVGLEISALRTFLVLMLCWGGYDDHDGGLQVVPEAMTMAGQVGPSTYCASLTEGCTAVDVDSERGRHLYRGSHRNLGFGPRIACPSRWVWSQEEGSRRVPGSTLMHTPLFTSLTRFCGRSGGSGGGGGAGGNALGVAPAGNGGSGGPISPPSS